MTRHWWVLIWCWWVLISAYDCWMPMIRWKEHTFLRPEVYFLPEEVSRETFPTTGRLARNFFSPVFLTDKADQPSGRVFWSDSLLVCLVGCSHNLPQEPSFLGVFWCLLLFGWRVATSLVSSVLFFCVPFVLRCFLVVFLVLFSSYECWVKEMQLAN